MCNGCDLGLHVMTRPDTVQKYVLIQDLLKALHFFECYSKETQLSGLFNYTEKTFCIRYKLALFNLAGLPMICFEKRHAA